MEENTKKGNLEERAESLLVEMLDRAPKMTREVQYTDVMDTFHESERTEISELVVLKYVGGANDGFEVPIAQDVYIKDRINDDGFYRAYANSLREQVRLAVNTYGEPAKVSITYRDEKRSRPIIINDELSRLLGGDSGITDEDMFESLDAQFFLDPDNEMFNVTLPFSRISQYVSDEAITEKSQRDLELVQRLLQNGAHFGKMCRPLVSFQRLHGLIEGSDSVRNVGRKLYDETLRLMGDSIDSGFPKVEYLNIAKRLAERFGLPSLSEGEIDDFQRRLNAFYDANPDEDSWREDIREMIREKEDSYYD